MSYEYVLCLWGQDCNMGFMSSQGRVPPHSDEVEASVLGAVLIDSQSMMEIAGWLKPEHFYAPAHGAIYEVMVSLYEDRKPIDLVTITEGLKAKKKLKQVGGATYVSELTNRVPTSANIEEYAKMVRDYSIKRNLILAAGKMAELGFDEGIDTKECMDQAEQAIFELSDSGTSKSFTSIREILSGSFDRLDELHKHEGGLRGIPTGFADLDDALAGLQNSNLLILAARPGVGKTTFGMNIAHYVSVEKKLPVGFFALEMSNEEMVDRMLVAQADIDAWKLKTGRLSPEDFSKLSTAMGELAEAPLFIDDTPGLSILEIRTRARRLKMSHGISMLVVDYLQLAHSSRKVDSRTQEVQEISQGLKNIARELKIPVIALSQLSRAVEQRGGIKKPQLSDLRESGSIEQDADVVMFLWREDEEDLSRVVLSIEKHRNGPLRNIPLYFKGDRIRYYGMDQQH